jgi:hypothetical protein
MGLAEAEDEGDDGCASERKLSGGELTLPRFFQNVDKLGAGPYTPVASSRQAPDSRVRTCPEQALMHRGET